MDNISQIKDKLDIIDVISGYIELKKSGRNYKGLCPFHGEKTPSFMVSKELQIFKCFGCGESGDIFAFVQKMEGLEFSDVLEKLAEKAGVVLEKKFVDKLVEQKKRIYLINENTTKFYQYLLWKHQSGKQALKYLKDRRKLTDKTIKNFRLGFAPDTWDLLYKTLLKKGFTDSELAQAGVIVARSNGQGYIDKFRNRVIFPLIEVDGKICGFTGRVLDKGEPKYLNTNETPVFHKTNFIYALDKARVEIKTKGAVFVEGQMDVISAHQAQIKNVVASGGTSLTDNQLKTISRYTNDITFCFDSDTAGITAIYRGIELAEKQNFNIKVVAIPKEYKDIDELIKKNPEEAKKLIENATTCYDFFVADNLKKFNKNSGDGKKRIIENLKPLLAKINNTVMLEHYIKQLSVELSTSEEVLYEIFKENKNVAFESENINDINMSEQNPHEKGPEAYYLALLLKCDLDELKEHVYSIDLENLTNSLVKNIAEKLKIFLQTCEKTFEIKKFLKTLDSNEQEKVTELYLLEPLDTQKELKEVYERLKKEWTKQKLKSITEQIKLAEMQNDSKQLEKLTKEFGKLSKELL